MKHALKAIGLILGLLPALAGAQSFPQTLPANTVVGRSGISSGPAQAIPFATLSRLLGGVVPGGTDGQIQINSAGSFGGTVTGAGVLSALGNPVGSAGAFVTFNGALGTPSSGVGSNLTALNASNISSGTLNTTRLPTPFANGTASGNGSAFVTTTGTQTSGRCVTIDSNGNHVAGSFACPGGVITPEQFSAVGNGTTDDTVPLTNMCNYAAVSANGVSTIRFGYGKTYSIWNSASGTPASTILCNLSSANGITVEVNGAVLTTNNAFTGGTAGFLYAFYLADAKNITINNLRYVQTVKTSLDASNGGVVVSISGSAASRLFVNNISITNAAQGVAASVLSWPTTEGPTGISIVNASFSGVYYPMSFQASGDSFFGRNINCSNVGRCYFAWNVHNHDVEINSNFGGTFSDVLIKTYCDSTATTYRNSTSDIKVVYRNPERYNNVSAQSLFAFEMQQNTASACSNAQLRNIDIRADVNQVSNAQPVGLTSYKLTSASAIDNTARSYIIENVSLRGVFQGYNSGNAILDLFNTTNGNFSGDTIRNIAIRDFVASGSSSSVAINATALAANLSIENVVSNVAWTITNAAANVLSYNRAAISSLTPSPLVLGGEGGPVYQGQVAILGVNFNSANTDSCTTIPLPPQVTRWRLNAVVISGPSATLASSTFGVYTDPAAAGTALVTPATATTVTTATDSTLNNMQITSGLSITNTDVTPCFRVGTASAAPATANVQLNYTAHP